MGDPTDTLAAAHLSLDDVEDRYVDAVLRQARGNKADAAAILGIDVSTLYRRSQRQRRR
jgi:DNA-binding protein Fis